jgi:hypothetical protein
MDKEVSKVKLEDLEEVLMVSKVKKELGKSQ